MATDIPGRDLNILLAQRFHDIAGRHAQCGDLVGVQPDAHRVIPGPKELDVADSFDAREVVTDLQKRVVGEIEVVVAPIRRHDADCHREVRRALANHHAVAANDFRELRLGGLHPVLHEHLGGIRIRPGLKRDGDRHLAVRRRGGRNVEHIVHAIDLLLDRRGYRARDRLGVGARIGSRHGHRGWNDVWILSDGQVEKRDCADENRHNRDDRREDRTIDKKPGNTAHQDFVGDDSGASLRVEGSEASRGASSGCTVWPGRKS